MQHAACQRSCSDYHGEFRYTPPSPHQQENALTDQTPRPSAASSKMSYRNLQSEPRMPNRRNFLKSLTVPAVAAGFPTIVPASALGLDGAVPASDRVTLASIGVGWMGGSHVDAFLKLDGAQYVALADLDDEHAAENKAKVDKKYGNTD